MKVRYNTQAKVNARTLRNNMTKSEVLLWMCLKGKKLGYRFIRQKVIGNYIVDFYCRELVLAVEIDGGYHQETSERDERRELELKQMGIKVYRCSTEDVEKNPEGVAEMIREFIEKNY